MSQLPLLQLKSEFCITTGAIFSRNMARGLGWLSNSCWTILAALSRVIRELMKIEVGYRSPPRPKLLAIAIVEPLRGTDFSFSVKPSEFILSSIPLTTLTLWNKLYIRGNSKYGAIAQDRDNFLLVAWLSQRIRTTVKPDCSTLSDLPEQSCESIALQMPWSKNIQQSLMQE